MKNKIFYFLFLSASCFANETLTVEQALTKIENNKQSYEYKNFENKKRSNDIKILDNKLGDFNGLTISSTFNASENLFPDRERKYDKTLQNKVSFGPLFVNSNYVGKDNSYISYGIEKNLKDVFYSKYRSDLKINKLSQELNQISYDKNLEAKKIELINLYKNILDVQNELEYTKKSYEHYDVELQKIKKSYELGASPKINLESVELEAENAKLQIDILETKLNSYYEIGKNDFDTDFKNYQLTDFETNKINIDSLLANYMKKDLEQIKINLQVAEERKKYSNYDRFMPDLYLAYERVDKNLRGDRYYRDQDVFSIKFSKKLFSTDSEYKLNVLENENLKNELQEKEKTIKSEKEKLKAEYNELLKLASIADKKTDIANKKYLIKEKEYELNRASYLDVIDEYNKYLAQEIETKKAKNNLNAFIYKIKINN
nr:TolC family protein [uncultured Fusobacterium sp.]